VTHAHGRRFGAWRQEEKPAYIAGPQCARHPEHAQAGHNLRPCSVCGLDCFVGAQGTLFMEFNPSLMLLCCACVDAKEIDAFLNGREFARQPVPDLRYMAN
jgi:hypothetical protein